MNIVFMGSSGFGVPALKGLINAGYNVSGVVTQADKRQGRGMLTVGHTPVKDAAIELKLKLFQPRDINSPESIQILKDLNPDILIVIAYGQILSQEVLDIPRIMPVNIHASLLPALRGPAPINWAIINGDKATGNTLMRITLKMDSGPVISQSRMDILEYDSAITLEDKLSVDAAELLLKGMELIKSGKYKLLEQDPAKVTIAPKLSTDTCGIDWNMPAERINDLIRGLLNWSAAFTYYKGKRLKIHSARGISAAGRSVKPGTVVSSGAEGIAVATGSGHLLISQLQPEGKRVMAAGEFIAGYKLIPGEEFTKNQLH
jgi:methionyl-tRNA formyltransferase